MATTKIWPVRDNLARVMQYAENHLKTANPNAYSADELADLHDVLQYAANNDKTHMQFYVSGINCTDKTAYDQMMATKQRFGKTGGNLAYHTYMSFRPDEVTPQECHKIGKELARRLWGDKYEILVSTHLNTHCVHCHFVINSVSFVDGKKFNNNYAAYFKGLRAEADQICRERGLSVIDNPKPHQNRQQYLAEKNGEPTRFNVYRQAMDDAIQHSVSPYTMKLVLEKQGFIVKVGDIKYWTIGLPGYRPTRMYRLGDNYTKEKIWSRFPQRPIFPTPTRSPEPRRIQFKGNLKQAKKITGFRALYFHYLYLLGKLPRNRPRPPRHPIMWEEIRRLDQYSAQIKLICQNKIDTSEQLQAFEGKTQNRLNGLIAQRNKLYNKIRWEKSPEVIINLRTQRDELTKLITACRKDLKLCDGIKDSTMRMKEKIKIVRQHEHPTKQKTIQKERGYYR